MKAELIVALDKPTADEALRTASALLPEVAFFKVGLSLFIAAGPSIVTNLQDLGASIFLDLKLHDIPAQVERASRIIGALGVDMMTVHSLGGAAMMKAALKGVSEGAVSAGKERPALIAVTILTSLDEEDLRGIGVQAEVEREVHTLAGLVHGAGLDGLVASAREISGLREAFGPELKLVSPGIRPESSALGDQKRVLTPARAVGAGADYLVVGRPITDAADPKDAAARVLSEMERGETSG